jgi:hypothetical protein
MSSFRARSRFATLVAVGLALLVSGVVAGAAGGNFILGQANSAGTSNTSLTTSSTGNGLLVTQNGTGTAIRGSTGSGSGIAGFFTSGSGSGVSGVVAAQNSYGVYAGNDSASEGTGAALRVNGKQNEGIIASSDDTNAVRGLVTGCDGGLGICGGNGVMGTGYFLGAGVYGDGANSLFGVEGAGGSLAGVYASHTDTDIPALIADSAAGTGVEGRGEGSDADFTNTTNAGGKFVGPNGVYGQTDVGFGTGVLAQANGGLNWALRAVGFTFLDGDLSITGTCTGCAAAMMAVNGSGSTLKQGDAVALDGVKQAEDGSIVLVVRAAKKNDAVIGVVDREMKAAPDSIKVGGEKRTVKVNGAADKKVTTPNRTVKAPAPLWQPGGTSVGADKFLRIITGGVYAFEGAAPADAAVGDALAVGATNGKLGKANADSSAKAGRYLGKLKDGRVVLMVSPN